MNYEIHKYVCVGIVWKGLGLLGLLTVSLSRRSDLEADIVTVKYSAEHLS